MTTKHHRDVWSIRERTAAGIGLAVSWVLLIASVLTVAWPVIPLAILGTLLWECEYEKQWLAACKRAGIDERETDGW